MRYHIDILPDAREQLRTLPEKIRQQIARKIDLLAGNPRPVQCKRLTGADYLSRLRSGDYRIVYQVADDIITVLVVRIANRREVHRNLPAKLRVRRSGGATQPPRKRDPR